MSFNAEVRARLGLDTEDFRRGLTKAGADAGKAGEDINRKLKRAFGAGDFFKGILAGLGIGSVPNLIEALVKPWSEAADKAKSIEESTERTLSIYQRIWASRRTDDQNLKENLKEQARIQKEIEGTTEKSTMGRIATSGAAQFGAPTFGKIVTREADLVKQAKLTEKLAELAAEEDQLRRKIKDTIKNTGEAQSKQAADEWKANEDLAEFQMETTREQLSLEGQIEDADVRLYLLKMKLIDADTEDIELKKEIAKIERDRGTLADKFAAEQEKAAEKITAANDKAREEIERTGKKRDQLKEKLKEEQAIQATIGETEAEQAKRLRSEAEKLNKAASDMTRKEADRLKDKIDAQEKINAALKIEYNLKKSTLSLGDVAAMGGTTSRAVRARRALRMRATADQFEARGSFGESNRLRGEADNIEQGLDRERREFGKPVAAAPGSWEAKYGKQVADRNASLIPGAQTRAAQVTSGGAKSADPMAASAGDIKRSADALEVIKNNLAPAALK